MLSLIIFALLFVNRYYSQVLQYDEIGVIEQIQTSEQATGNEGGDDTATAEQQINLLRRRLMPGGLTTSDKSSILDTHNKYRTTTAQGKTYGQPSATNMNELIWDDGLAAVAQAYSSQCIWGHNGNRNQDLLNYASETSFQYTNQEVGENLFITSGSETLSVLLQGIEYWYDEYTYYTYGTTSGTAACQSGQQCGHYTQLVWGQTRYVGCGYTKCPSTSGVSITNGLLFVCNYYFAGNVVGYYPYESGSSSSNCDSDRSPSGGLCSGCPNPSWDTYCCQYCSSSSCSNAENSGLLNSPSSCTNGLGTIITSVLDTEQDAIASPSTTTTTTTTHAPTTTTHSPTTASPTTASPTTASPTTASPTTASPTTASPTTASTTRSPTTHSPTTTTHSPTTTTTTTTHSASSKQCCKASNSRYTTFCNSISSSQTCETYSSLCSWSSC